MKRTGKGEKGYLRIESVASAVAHNGHGRQCHRAPQQAPPPSLQKDGGATTAHWGSSVAIADTAVTSPMGIDLSPLAGDRDISNI